LTESESHAFNKSARPVRAISPLANRNASFEGARGSRLDADDDIRFPYLHCDCSRRPNVAYNVEANYYRWMAYWKIRLARIASSFGTLAVGKP